MSKQIRGVILEGQSCAGKTSIFNALKRLHPEIPDAERNVIFLAEHYSQTLNWVNGTFQNLTREENLKVLSDRISMLEQLNAYANTMGDSSRHSRGLFFVFERFHLNYAVNFNDLTSDAYVAIESRLINLNALTVLCTNSPEKTEQRLLHRAAYITEPITKEYVDNYNKDQRHRVEMANKSSVPTIIMNTDDLDWDSYARMILDHIQV
jgi:hypothetical protein